MTFPSSVLAFAIALLSGSLGATVQSGGQGATTSISLTPSATFASPPIIGIANRYSGRLWCSLTTRQTASAVTIPAKATDWIYVQGYPVLGTK
jgi:hypothetical protein